MTKSGFLVYKWKLISNGRAEEKAEEKARGTIFSAINLANYSESVANLWVLSSKKKEKIWQQFKPGPFHFNCSSQKILWDGKKHFQFTLIFISGLDELHGGKYALLFARNIQQFFNVALGFLHTSNNLHLSWYIRLQ
jgi:hypothetical protein